MSNLTNSSQIGDIIQNTNWNRIADYLSFLAREITNKLTIQLNEWGLNSSQRFSGLLVFFFSLLLLFIGVKIGKPIIKWALIVLSIIIVVGSIIPSW